MESEYFRYDMHKVLPIINQEGSDSAMLDNALEFMVMSGMDLPLAVMVTIPAPGKTTSTWTAKSRISTDIMPP